MANASIRSNGDAEQQTSLLKKWRATINATRSPDLTRADLAVLVAVLNRINKQLGNAWPSFSRIAIDANVNRATVARCIRRLSDFGFLLCEHGNRSRSNRYSIGVGSCAAATTNAYRAGRLGATRVVAPMQPDVVAPVRPELSKENLSSELEKGTSNKVKTRSSAKRRRTSVPRLKFSEWIAGISGAAIPADDEIFNYAETIGLDWDYLLLAWREFSRRNKISEKRERDWREAFRRFVRGNWGKIWFEKSGQFLLTTEGAQLKMEVEAAEDIQLEVRRPGGWRD